MPHLLYLLLLATLLRASSPPPHLMAKLPQHETLAELKDRHAKLVAAPYLYTEWSNSDRDRFDSQLVSVELDLRRFHTQDEQAAQLLRQLSILGDAALFLSVAAATQRLLHLLQAATQ